MSTQFCGRCGERLVPAAIADHQPQCPKCGWFRATEAMPVVLVLARAPSGRILYTRQRGWPEQAWGLVAGFVERGETAEQAAIREVQEETGLEASDVRVQRTLTFDDLLLVVVEAEIPDGQPVAASDVANVLLCEPDLALTPAEWPAHSVVADHISRQGGAAAP